jgi:Putative transposase DNA-binding domain
VVSRARKRPKDASTFVATIPLRASPTQAREVGSRFECARLLYNACLRVALDRAGEQTTAMPRLVAGKPNPARAEAFRELRVRHGFSERELMSVASGLRVGWLQWGAGFVLPFAFDPSSPYRWWAAAHVASGRLRSCRIVRSKVRGRWVCTAQLVLDGKPLARNQVGAGLVGLDVGPSTVAVVSNAGTWKEALCGELDDKARELRRLQRRLDRQHRVGSPTCFHEGGRHKAGSCDWQVRSKRAQGTQTQIHELQRRMAEHRRSLHGNLANRILGQGWIIHTEKLSYRAFQRRFGRSVGRRAPGMFVTTLSRKAVSAGGTVALVDTWSTRLSQRCVCGAVAKKPLSQRTHRCGCGVEADRDVFSAFLARYVDPRVHPHLLDEDGARKALPMLQDSGAGRRRAVFNRRVPQALPVGCGVTRRSRSAESPQGAADAREGAAA